MLFLLIKLLFGKFCETSLLPKQLRFWLRHHFARGHFQLLMVKHIRQAETLTQSTSTRSQARVTDTVFVRVLFLQSSKKGLCSQT